MSTKTLCKTLYPSFSYTEALRKSGLDRLDCRHDLITQCMFRERQGGHQRGKVREFDSGQGKVRESGKSQDKVRENVFCLWCVTAIAMVTA